MHYCTRCEKNTEDTATDFLSSKEFEVGQDLVYRQIDCAKCSCFKFGFHTMLGTESYGENL